MSNRVYPKAAEAFASGDIDWLADTIKVIPLSASYVYDAAHDFLNDVSAGYRLDTAATLTGKTATNGVCDSTTNPTFTGIAVGETIASLLVYQHTGTESTSHLICLIDTRGDTTPVTYVGDGNPVQVQWSSRGIFKV